MTYLIVGLIAGWCAVFGIAAASLAEVRGRNTRLWALGGVCFGPVALVGLALVPPRRCRECHARLRGSASRCAACGADQTAASPPAKLAPPTGARPDAPTATPVRPDPVRPPGSRPTAPLVTTAPTATARPPARAPVVATTAAPAPPAPAPATPPVPAPTAAAPVAPARGTPAEARGRLLASAIATGGTIRLEIGRRYILELVDARLQVRGPADTKPEAVVASWPIITVQVDGMGNQLVARGPGSPRSSLAAGFTNPSGMTVDAIKRAIEEERQRLIHRSQAEGTGAPGAAG